MPLSNEIIILSITAGSIGFFHTLLGPDHYIPFIALSKAKNWTLKKTLFITSLCSVGHITGSFIIGLFGIALGTGLSKIEVIEAFRGDIASWMLITFGLAYFVWGIKSAHKNKKHCHTHLHKDITHSHDHTHHKKHTHIHEEKGKIITPWALFIIFIFGPCETLIPLLMYPAVNESIFGLVLVTSVFSISTLLAMILSVSIAYLSLKTIKFTKIEQYSHALAGATITLSGLAVVFLGV